MEKLNGTYDGTVKEAKFSEFTDKETDKNVLVLNFTCIVDVSGDRYMLFPALFFDDTIVDQGLDMGKTRIEVSLSVLRSMGLDVDEKHLENNNPVTWIADLADKPVRLYCKEKDGKQICYLNRLGRPPLDADRTKELWAILTGHSDGTGFDDPF